MKKEKLLKRIKEQVKFMIEELNFDKVHIESYKDSRGKTRYKGKIRVHNTDFTFINLSIYDVNNVFDGILIGYTFALDQIEYEAKK